MSRSIWRCGLALIVFGLGGCASNKVTYMGNGNAMDPAPKATPFLLFQDGRAEQAMRFYAELFEGGRVLSVERYGKDRPGGPDGTLYAGFFEVGGLRMRCMDSPAPHDFGFTPAISIFMECSSDAEITRLAAALGEDGKVFMPLNNYGFSEKFTWVEDRYGISWQLNLAGADG